MDAPPETRAPQPVSSARPPQACVACAGPDPHSPHHHSLANSLLQLKIMYRFIDTVSIDATSITGYHPGRGPREESSVDRSEAREVRLERQEPASGGLRRFAGKDIFRRLTLIATVSPVRYSSGDARHQISTERRERQLRTFRRSWNYAPLDLRSPHRGRFLFGQAGRHASFVSTYRACVRVCRRDVLFDGPCWGVASVCLRRRPCRSLRLRSRDRTCEPALYGAYGLFVVGTEHGGWCDGRGLLLRGSVPSRGRSAWRSRLSRALARVADAGRLRRGLSGREHRAHAQGVEDQPREHKA